MKNLLLVFILPATLLCGCESSLDINNYSLVNSDFIETTNKIIFNGNVEFFSTDKEYLAFINSRVSNKLHILQADDPKKINGKINGIITNVEIISNQDFFLINPVYQNIVYVFTLNDYKGFKFFELIEQKVEVHTGYGISDNKLNFSELLTTLRNGSLKSIYQSDLKNINCTSGGEGSFGCTVGDDNEYCIVICQSGYFGCCNSGQLCKCITGTQ